MDLYLHPSFYKHVTFTVLQQLSLIYVSVGKTYLIFCYNNFIVIKGFVRGLSYIRDSFKDTQKKVFIFLGRFELYLRTA